MSGGDPKLVQWTKLCFSLVHLQILFLFSFLYSFSSTASPKPLAQSWLLLVAHRRGRGALLGSGGDGGKLRRRRRRTPDVSCFCFSIRCAHHYTLDSHLFLIAIHVVSMSAMTGFLKQTRSTLCELSNLTVFSVLYMFQCSLRCL